MRIFCKHRNSNINFQNFNETLPNYVVNVEQLGPEYFIFHFKPLSRRPVQVFPIKINRRQNFLFEWLINWLVSMNMKDGIFATVFLLRIEICIFILIV